MKLFNDGMEIRLTRDDLALLLIDSLNQKFFILGAGRQSISELTVHPRNKYIARVTIKPEKQ